MQIRRNLEFYSRTYLFLPESTCLLSCAWEIQINAIKIAIETIEAGSVPKSKPPFDNGLVKKSPKVAPNGLVNMKASQKSNTSFILVA